MESTIINDKFHYSDRNEKWISTMGGSSNNCQKNDPKPWVSLKCCTIWILQEFAFGQIKTQYFVLYYYFNKIKHLLKK